MATTLCVYQCLGTQLTETVVMHCLQWLVFEHPHPTDPLALLLRPYPTSCIQLTRRIWMCGFGAKSVAWIDCVNQKSGTRICTSLEQAAALLRIYNRQQFIRNSKFYFEETCMSGSIPGVAELLKTTEVICTPDRALLAAAYSGNLDLIRYVLEYFELPVSMLSGEHHAVLHCAIARGHVNLVDWLREQLGLLPADFRASGEHSYFNPQEYVLPGGTDWSKLEDQRRNSTSWHRFMRESKGDDWSILEAISQELVPMVRYLFERVGLEAEHLKASCSKIMSGLIYQGKVRVLRYLYRRTIFTQHDLRDHYFSIRCRLGYNDLEMMKFIHREVGFGTSDFNRVINSCLGSSIVQYLHRQVGCGPKDFKSPAYLSDLIGAGSLDTLQYLMTEVGIVATDFQDVTQFNLPTADFSAQKCEVMVRFLHLTVGFTATDFKTRCDNLIAILCPKFADTAFYLLKVVGLDLSGMQFSQQDPED